MRFSIVTVALNDLEGLRRTYHSVASQSYTDFEWLVVDGGSGDGTAEWLAALDMPPLRWRSEPDEGIYDAMNKGIERAQGDYLVFLNAGDAFADESVLDAVRAAADGARAADFVFGDAIDVTEDGLVLYKKARAHTSRWWTMFGCHQAMFFNRERVGEARYRLRYRHAADYAFVAEFLRDDHPAGPPLVKRIDAALCRFWLGGDSWQHRSKGIREDFDIRAKYIGVSPPVNALLFVAHHAHTWVKRNVPWLARKLRYGQ